MTAELRIENEQVSFHHAFDAANYWLNLSRFHADRESVWNRFVSRVTGRKLQSEIDYERHRMAYYYAIASLNCAEVYRFLSQN